MLKPGAEEAVGEMEEGGDPTESKNRWLEEFMEYLQHGTAEDLKNEYKPAPPPPPAEEVVEEEPAAPAEEADALEGLDEESLKALLAQLGK